MSNLKREERTRTYLEVEFKILFADIKKGYFKIAKKDLERIAGTINYANYIGDLTDANYNKILHLLSLIRKKYDIY